MSSASLFSKPSSRSFEKGEIVWVRADAEREVARYPARRNPTSQEEGLPQASGVGNGVTTYIVVFTTSGAASCPRSTPVENVHASRKVLGVVGGDLSELAEAG